jgi:hypothetical protein
VLLGAAFACAALAATTVAARGGLSYINLDSFLDDPLGFSVLLVLPAAFAAICLTVAAAPLAVAVNAIVFCFLVGLLEAGAWLIAPAHPVHDDHIEALGEGSFYVSDKTLGYVMAPSVSARHRGMVAGRQIYDVVYRTDAWGRRETPASAEPKHRFLLFLGGSNTFGWGLSQTETLPYYAGEVAKGYRPYNYGVPGYGPSHGLALARRGGLREQIAEPDGYAIFFLIPDHVGRAVGSSRLSSSWGRHFPCFVESARGEVVTTGDFVRGRPLTTLAYAIWNKSKLADYFGVELPLWYTTSDYRLTAKILKESSRLLAQQVNLRGFIVVLGQADNDDELRVIHGVRDALALEGVRYLDYTGLFDWRDIRYRLSEHDYHNSALANRIIATRLVADLMAKNKEPASVSSRSSALAGEISFSWK